MASPLLRRRRFAEPEGCVLPSIKHQTCRERAVALLPQEKEHDCTCNVQLVKDLQERVSRIQEENLRLTCELKKCQEHLQWKDRELQRQASEVQKERSEYEKNLKEAEERICMMEESLKSLEGSYVNMVTMAVNRELELEECQQEKRSKDEEIRRLQMEVKMLQEQRSGSDKDFKKAEERVHRLIEGIRRHVCEYRAVKDLKFEPGGSRHVQKEAMNSTTSSASFQTKLLQSLKEA